MLSRRSSKNSHRRRKQRQKYNRLARFEQLEDRRLLTISTPILGSSNDVVFNGDGVADSIEFSVGGDLLQHNLGGSFGFNSNSDLDSVTAGDQTRMMSAMTSLSYVDSGKNVVVEFSGPTTLSFASANLSVGAGTITINSGGSLTSGAGAINLTADRSVVLRFGSSVTTENGEITLSANASGNATGAFAGNHNCALLDSTDKTFDAGGTDDELDLLVGDQAELRVDAESEGIEHHL